MIISLIAASFVAVSRLKNGGNNERRELLRFWSDGDFEQAYKISKNALLEKPVDYFLLTINGFSAYQLGISQINSYDKLIFIDESIFSLRKALLHKESSGDGRVFYVLGKAYGYKGNEYADLAVKYLEMANSLSYEAKDIPEYLGLAYAAYGDYRNSVAAFSLAFNPENEPSDNLLLSIARSYMAMEEYSMAVGYLKRCIDTSPDSKSIIVSRFLLAEIYKQSGDYENAENQYLSILNEAGENAEVHYQLGELYSIKGDTTRARSEWRIAYRQDPAHQRARARLNI
ncbi:MAG: hypothetical protein LBQ93_06300 [Treponema sp.]|nr:hypothetical protein [Treponema sp.]